MCVYRFLLFSFPGEFNVPVKTEIRDSFDLVETFVLSIRFNLERNTRLIYFSRTDRKVKVRCRLCFVPIN